MIMCLIIQLWNMEHVFFFQRISFKLKQFVYMLV